LYFILILQYSYLIHSPFHTEDKAEHQARWKQMEELKAQGLTKSIGVSHYHPEHLDLLLETATIPPAVNQIEFHPYLQHPDWIEYHKKKVIGNPPFPPSLSVSLSLNLPPLSD
jgi:diketogulonate reductase-like aldo/keto reductase